MKQTPISTTLGITIVVLLLFCCRKWKCGPLFVLQVWLVNLRTFLQWLIYEAIGGVRTRWPRFEEMRERIQRGEKSGRQQATVEEPSTVTILDAQSETV